MRTTFVPIGMTENNTMSDRTKEVYAYLKSISDENGCCSPTLASVAKVLKRGVNKLSRDIAELTNNRYISKKTVKNRNVYRIINNDLKAINNKIKRDL